MKEFFSILDDIEALNIAFESSRLSIEDRWLVHLEKLYVSNDGEKASRSPRNRVLHSDTRFSCSKIGGLLSSFFEDVGPEDAMMWIGHIQREENGDERWVMRPEIRASLQSLNWFGPGPSIGATTKYLASDQTTYGDDRTELAQRETRFMSVEVRSGQARFRRAVFNACNGACVISGCPVPEVLEAAHLKGRKWRAGDNSASDGILLRRDLHALYDSDLLGIDASGVVQIDATAAGSYSEFHGRKILLLGTCNLNTLLSVAAEAHSAAITAPPAEIPLAPSPSTL